MKILRTVLFAVMAICFFGSAKAQVRINAHIGDPPQRRTVIVHRPAHRYPVRRHSLRHRRTVVVRRHY